MVEDGEWQTRGLCAQKSKRGLWDLPFLGNQYASARHQQVRDAVEACGSCPVLAECRVYAAKFRWAGVVIGGWVPDARRTTGEFPPWSYPQAGDGGGESEVLSA